MQVLEKLKQQDHQENEEKMTKWMELYWKQNINIAYV
jgi:hypothetical protein